ncbi:MAG TPA: hypothetical protein VGP24_04415, partial [Glaciihabitans sp.]|nr:hypothetical protein [Glaciihabitans sp.]
MPLIARTAAPASSTTTTLPGAAGEYLPTSTEVASTPPLARKRSWLIAALGLFAALVIAIEAPGPVRALIVLTAWLLVPGWALIRHVAVPERAARVALVVVSSGTIAALASVIMVWTQWWYPLPVAVCVLVVASVSLIVPAASAPVHVAATPRSALNPSRRLARLWPWGVLVGAITLWLISLARTSTDDLGQWGLLPEFPATWYIGVALAAVLCIGSVVRFQFPTGLMSASVASLVVMLYGSAGLVEEAPRLPWIYKHIAVTSYIDANGAVDPQIDLYNRWPGFFSTSAFLGQAIGYPNPVDYAAWAEVGFALIGVVLVLAIARVFSRNSQWVWTVALVFIVGNWVGQNYYSPQAFAF